MECRDDYNLSDMFVVVVLLYLAAYGTFELMSRRPRSVAAEEGAAGNSVSSPPAAPEARNAEMKRAALRIFGAGVAGLAIAVLFLTMLFPSDDGATGNPRPPSQSQPLPAGQPRIDPSLVKFAPIQSGLSFEERDAQRLVDLPRIQVALEAYFGANGSYPANGGLQSACRFIELDSGCLIAPYLNPYPVDPAGGDTSYAYQSDGRTYLLTTIWEGATEPPAEFSCPPDFRRQTKMICLYKR